MSLLKLIKNLDNSTKTLLLGDETTKILKYTFTNSEHEAVDSNIIDLAISIQLGPSLISKKENRKLSFLSKLTLKNLKNLRQSVRLIIIINANNYHSN